MAISGIMQQYRGKEADFDADKMKPGQFAVSLDKKYVRMCFALGDVKRIALYDAFEEDMRQIQQILATCQDIQIAVEAFEKLAEQHKTQAESYSVESKSWAIGGTGTRTGEDTDNSMYYSQQAKLQADRAETAADKAESITDVGIASNDKAGIVKGNSDEFGIAADGKLSLTSTFTEQSELSEIDGTENKKTLFGKIVKAVGMLITHIADKSIHYLLTNNLLATVPGTALDAVQGKALDERVTANADEIAKLNGNLKWKRLFYGTAEKGVEYATDRSFVGFTEIAFMLASGQYCNNSIVFCESSSYTNYVVYLVPVADGYFEIKINKGGESFIVVENTSKYNIRRIYAR